MTVFLRQVKWVSGCRFLGGSDGEPHLRVFKPWLLDFVSLYLSLLTGQMGTLSHVSLVAVRIKLV